MFTNKEVAMKALIVYDTVHGNTEQIARAVAEALAPIGEVNLRRVGDAGAAELGAVDLLVVGSPTHGGRPTPPVQSLLDKIPANGLADVRVAAFDTRVRHFMAKLFGYAGGRIAKSLKAKGGQLVGEPAGFFVKKTEGPLEPGEAERAAAWAREVAEGAK
jgi:flavodoxin